MVAGSAEGNVYARSVGRLYAEDPDRSSSGRQHGAPSRGCASSYNAVTYGEACRPRATRYQGDAGAVLA